MNSLNINIQCDSEQEVQKYFNIIQLIQSGQIESLVKGSIVLEMIYWASKGWIDKLLMNYGISCDTTSDNKIMILLQKQVKP